MPSEWLMNDVDDRMCNMMRNWIPPPTPEPEVVLSLSTCCHIFHEKCIMGWIASASSERNLCTKCKTPLYRLEVLAPELEVHCLAERWNIATTAQKTDAFIEVLTAADELFVTEHGKAGDEPDFARIPRYIRDQWECSGKAIEHFSDHGSGSETRLFELIVAQRVHDRLVEANVQDSWAGQMFMGLYANITATFDRLYRTPKPATPFEEYTANLSTISNEYSSYKRACRNLDHCLDEVIADADTPSDRASCGQGAQSRPILSATRRGVAGRSCCCVRVFESSTNA